MDGLDIPPEILAQVMGLQRMPEEQDIINQQMVRAMGLQKPSGHKYSTPGGALLGGLGDIIGAARGDRMQRDAQAQQHALGDRQGTALAATERFLPTATPEQKQQIAGMWQSSGDPALQKRGEGLLEMMRRDQERADALPGRKLQDLLLKEKVTQIEDDNAPVSQALVAMGREQGIPFPPNTTNRQAKEWLGLKQRGSTEDWTPFTNGVTGQTFRLNRKTGKTEAIIDNPVAIARPGRAGGDDVDKALGKLRDDLDASKARTGQMGKDMERLGKAQNLLALTEGEQGLNLDSRQMTEYAIGLANLLGGGPAGEHTIQSLLPQTMKGKSAGWKEWLLNEPHGAEQQQFVARMKETIERERDLAANRIREAQIKRLPAHINLQRSHPGEFNAVLQGYGIDPGVLDDNLLPKPQSKAAPEAHPKDQAALDWAKAHPQDPRAQAILKMSGG